MHDALSETCLTFMGPGIGPPTLSRPHFCVIEPAPRTNTVKPTAIVAECALVRHSVNLFGTKTNIIGAQLLFRHRALSGFVASTTDYSPWGKIVLDHGDD